MRAQERITHEFGNSTLFLNYTQEYLEISLKVRKASKIEVFEKVLTNQSLMYENFQTITDIQLLFENLREKQNLFVDEQEGKVIKKVYGEYNVIKYEEILLQKFETLEMSQVKKQVQEPSKEVSVKDFSIESEHFFEEKVVYHVKKQIEMKMQILEKNFNLSYEQPKEEANIKELKRLVQKMEAKLKATNQINEKLISMFQNHQNLYYKQIKQTSQRIGILEDRINEICKGSKSIDESKSIKEDTKSEQESIKQINQSSMFQRLSDKAERITNKKEDKMDIQQNFILQDYYNFKIQDSSMLTYVGRDKDWNIVLKNYPLLKENVYQFEFKIHKSSFKNFNIGICYKNYRKRNFKKESMYLSLGNGYINLMDSIKSGRIGRTKYIKMEINLQKMMIGWFLDDEKIPLNFEINERFFCSLKQKVPFISFFNQGDVVQWIK